MLLFYNFDLCGQRSIAAFILSSLPLFGINIIHNTLFEAGMIALALAIGSYSLRHGYLRHHHNPLPLLLFVAGFVFLILKQFFIQFENWLLLPAVMLIITAHFLNYRFCRAHNHAHQDDCNHGFS
jgi:hypothetical protein